MLKAVHHIAIIVSDYEVSREFYVNKLGFEVIRENYRPGCPWNCMNDKMC